MEMILPGRYVRHCSCSPFFPYSYSYSYSYSTVYSHRPFNTSQYSQSTLHFSPRNFLHPPPSNKFSQRSNFMPKFNMSDSSTDSSCSLSQVAPLEAVLFDVDGTLCDSDPIHHHAFREMLQEIGFNGGVPITEDYFVENIAGKHNEDIATLLFPDDHERGLKFCDDKEAYFRRLASEQLKPIAGLHKLRKWIEDRGLKRAAVTNAPKPNADLMISQLGLSDFFQAVVLGSECEHPKPAPDAYLKALEILKVSKDRTIIFEDSVSGIKAGVAAGVPVIGLTTRNPPRLLNQAKPTFLIQDYEDQKLWTALEELDSKSGKIADTA